MMLGVRVILFHVSRYDFKADDGKQLVGGKLQALELDGGPDDGTDAKGYRPITIDATPQVLDQIELKQLPGYFDLSVRFKRKAGKNGQMLTPEATAVLFVSPALQPVKERQAA